jgi:hypothetical protein
VTWEGNSAYPNSTRGQASGNLPPFSEGSRGGKKAENDRQGESETPTGGETDQQAGEAGYGKEEKAA